MPKYVDSVTYQSPKGQRAPEESSRCSCRGSSCCRQTDDRSCQQKPCWSENVDALIGHGTGLALDFQRTNLFGNCRPLVDAGRRSAWKRMNHLHGITPHEPEKESSVKTTCILKKRRRLNASIGNSSQKRSNDSGRLRSRK